MLHKGDKGRILKTSILFARKVYCVKIKVLFLREEEALRDLAL